MKSFYDAITINQPKEEEETHTLSHIINTKIRRKYFTSPLN